MVDGFEICPIKLSQDLIRFNSVTPDCALVFDYLEDLFKSYDLKPERKIFKESGTYDVENMYVSFQPEKFEKSILFCGHVDVVPVGNIDEWDNDPFCGEIFDNMLYGRGSADMKSGVACGIVSFLKYIKNNPKHKVSILITGDEEELAINGVAKALPYLKECGEYWDECITLEPTNIDTMHDQIKIGRRGSYTVKLEIIGKQGHVGYPERVNNAIHLSGNIINDLSNYEFNDNNEFFDDTSLQIVNIKSGTGATNIAPGVCEIVFNTRFSSSYDFVSLRSIFENILQKNNVEYKYYELAKNESFVTNPDNDLVKNLVSAIENVCGFKPSLATNGGTSDSRFIKNFCNVVDFGVSGKTIHQVNEKVSIDDIITLEKIIFNYLSNR